MSYIHAKQLSSLILSNREKSYKLIFFHKS